MKKIICVIALLCSTVTLAKNEYTIAEAITTSHFGQPYNKIKLSSTHFVSITNPTDKVIGYQITYAICTERGCVDKKYTKNIEPYNNFQNKDHLEHYVSYQKPDTYRFWVKTFVVSDEKKYSEYANVEDKIYVY